MRTLQFKVLKWQLEEMEQELFIHATGLTQNNESTHVRIEGFQPFVFLELPSNVEWNIENQKNVVRFLQKKMCINNIKYSYEQKFLLMYKTPAEFLKITLPTSKLIQNLSYKIYNKNGLIIPGIGSFEYGRFRLHEHNIDPLIKYTSMMNIKLGGWIQVTERKNIKYEKLTSCDIDMSVYYKRVEPFECKIRINPSIFSFDIETYSKNKNSKHPNPTIKENCVFQIAVLFGRFNDDIASYSIYLLTYPGGSGDAGGSGGSGGGATASSTPGSGGTTGGTNIKNYKSERDLIIGFSELINVLNPDIFIGYNILKFDWNYLLVRAAHVFNGCYNRLLGCGRIYGKKSEKDVINWSSKAYGRQKFEYLNLDGRLNIDILPEIERNYRFDNYKLDTVSEIFLKENKEDMSYKQMFTLFEMSQIVNAKKTKVSRLKKMLKKCMEVEDFIEPKEGDKRNHVLEIWKLIKKSTSYSNIKLHIEKGFKWIGTYCIQDSRLPIKLFHKLHLLDGLEQMANVTCVPSWYLQTRGQQIKVLAQLYRRALKANVVIGYRKNDLYAEDTTKYQGATVITAVPGFYRYVVNFDFASLYPSIIIAKNICYTTIVRNSDPISDEQCHIIQWFEHRGCPHDTSGNKVKKEDVLCGSHRYRFKKQEYGGEGLIPMMLRELLSERKLVKKEMKKYSYTDIDYIVLDALQLGLKISANSTYGFYGASVGYCPLKEGAASVTAEGREMNHNTVKLIKDKYENANIVYGDSVSGDTPIVVRINKKKIQIISIQNAFEMGYICEYPQFKLNDANISNSKEQSLNNGIVETWTSHGWSLVKRFIRHKCNKKMYRVNTYRGSVDATEDHSLLDVKKQIIKPKNIVINKTVLLSGFPTVPIQRQTQLNFLDELMNKVDAQQALYLLKCSGYTNINVVEINGQYSLRETTIPYDNVVLDVKYLRDTMNEYVYDIETEDGTFLAGVGEIICKNTDSVMVQFTDVKNTKELFKTAKEAAKYVTSKFLKPNELEFECIYDPFIQFTKKRYTAHIIDENDKIEKIVEKGVLSARRDNFHFIRNDLYKIALKMIREFKNEDEVMYYLINAMNSMFQLKIPKKKFVLYMSVKELKEYEEDAKNVNALLAKKMASRGDDVSNTRLEFVYLKTADKLKGSKAEDWSYFIENYRKKNLRIDYLCYLEKCINPFTELFQILYPKKEILYENSLDAIERQIHLLNIVDKDDVNKLERMSHIRTINDKIKYIKLYFSREKYPLLFNACDRHISREVLNKLYKKYGITKRPPTQRPKRGEVTIRNDAKLMNEFYKAHKYYHLVVEQLNEMFSPFEFVE